MPRGIGCKRGSLLYLSLTEAARILGMTRAALEEALLCAGMEVGPRIHRDVVEQLAQATGLEVAEDMGITNIPEDGTWPVPEWMAIAAREVTARHIGRVAALQREVEALRLQLAQARARIIELERRR